MLSKLLGGDQLGTIRQSEIEARQNGSTAIEAEHLLLALAADSGGDAARLLNRAGLDYKRITAALGDEHSRSLAFAGVRPHADRRVEATELDGPLGLGTSAKAAIKRALIASRQGRPRMPRLNGTNLLLGILQAELGTVPRLLAIASVDRVGLIERLRPS
jgi:ATP-dependent Clp protease ATP-binding subunit ClpA